MRKPLLLIALAVLFATATQAQNRAVLLHESFDGLELPEGWSIADQGLENWSVSTTQMAGGLPNEMQLGWAPQFEGVSRLVTPPVDLTGITSVSFSFKHYLYGYTEDPCYLGIATSSDGGQSWHEGWKKDYFETGVYQVSEPIQTEDMGKPNVRFCIYFEGDTYNIYNWYVDDIEVFTVENSDLGILSISSPSVMPYDGMNIGMEVFNYGRTAVTSIEAQYVIEGQSPVNEVFAVSIPPMQKATLDFSSVVDVMPGHYELEITLLKVNGSADDNVDNDSFTKSITVTLTSVESVVMIESFASASSDLSAENNRVLEEICTNHPNQWAFTKYSVLGDPYNNTESLDRADYYSVLGVPQTFFNGENQGVDIVSESDFAKYLNKEAFVDLRGSFSMNGSWITVEAYIMPYLDTHATVFIAVNEKTVEGSVGSNGETEFHHVMMKMLPNSDGSSLPLVAGEAWHIEYAYDLADTSVEDLDDLEVVVWAQADSKEILNSCIAYEYVEEHPNPVKNLTLNCVGLAAFEAAWDAPTEGMPTGYNVFVNRELVAENIAERSYRFEVEGDKYYVVEVQAVYSNGMTSVKSVAGLKAFNSVDENEVASCKVYPNPAQTQVRIEAENDIKLVRVYDMLGNLVQTLSGSGNVMDISLLHLSKGVYLFNVVESNGHVGDLRVIVTQ